MVTQAIGTFCLVFTTSFVTFLATLKTNEFIFTCIHAVTELLALKTPKWVWDENIHIHTKVSNYQTLGWKGLAKHEDICPCFNGLVILLYNNSSYV